MTVTAYPARLTQVCFEEQHGTVIPKDVYSLIFKKLKPFELLIASQVNKGWHSQIACKSTCLQLDDPTDPILDMVDTARKIWDKHTKPKGQAYLNLQKQKVEQASNRIKNAYRFRNENIVNMVAIYQNLFLRFDEFNLKNATSIFHKQFGMPIEQLTKKYFKSHLSSFDIQLGSLSFLKELSIEDNQKFIRTCIDTGQAALVMSNLNGKISDFQQTELHQYVISLFNSTSENHHGKVFNNNLGILLNDFFERGCYEIKNNPTSDLAQKLKPTIEKILQDAGVFAGVAGDSVYHIISKPPIFGYGFKWLLGFNWTLTVPKFLVLEGLARAGGLITRHYVYKWEREDLIRRLITAFPEYQEWQNEILYLYDLHKMIFDIKNSLEKNNFCSLSQKILTQAVKTPEGKIFDFQAIAIELDKNPKKYAFTKKDLRPDFEKMHQVYKDIIQNMEAYIKRGWDRTVRGVSSPLAIERQEHLSDNALHLRSILEQGKLYSFEEVQNNCTQELEDFLKENRHLSILFAEGKLTKDEYRVYSKYAKLKSEIKEDYHYNLALKT